MSSLKNIRKFVNDRLAAAAQEIFGVFQQTVSELEEELDRQRKLVEVLRNPPLVRLQMEDVQQTNPGDFLGHQGPSLDHEEQDCQQNEDEMLQNASLVHVKVEDERQEETLTNSSTQHIKSEAGAAMYSDALLNSLHQRSLSHQQHDTSNNGFWREPVETQPGLDSIEQEFSQVTNDYESASYSGYLSNSRQKSCSKETFTCSVCGKCFSVKRSLKAHMIIHTGDKPFSCSHCGRCFNQRHNLKAHMRIHSGEKPYHCPQCNKSFRQRSALRSHMRLHSGEKPHRCSQCGDDFSWSYQLKHHMTLHMVEKPS